VSSPESLVRSVDSLLRSTLEQYGFTLTDGVFVQASITREVWPALGMLKIKNRSSTTYRLDPTIGIHVPVIENAVARWLGTGLDAGALTMVVRYDRLCRGKNFTFDIGAGIPRLVEKMVAAVLSCGENQFWGVYNSVDRVLAGLRDSGYATPYRRQLAPAAVFKTSGWLDLAQDALEEALTSYAQKGGGIPVQLADAAARARLEIFDER